MGCFSVKRRCFIVVVQSSQVPQLTWLVYTRVSDHHVGQILLLPLDMEVMMIKTPEEAKMRYFIRMSVDFLKHFMKSLVSLYIKGFRVKFASYQKFGSKWFRGSVHTMRTLSSRNSFGLLAPGDILKNHQQK